VHVLFERPAYHHIRVDLEDALFTEFGGVSQVIRFLKTPGNPREGQCLYRAGASKGSCLCLGVFGSIDNLKHQTYYFICPEQGVKLLGLLLAGSTGQQGQVELGWPDIHG
jgi:hypothetical protein